MEARGCPTTASDCGASPHIHREKLALLGSITVDVQYAEKSTESVSCGRFGINTSG